MDTSIALDRAGFPMIRIEALNAHIHWLPVTKIQFEYFLWSTRQTGLDQAWMDRVYQFNPRETPAKLGGTNYWRAFITGVAPAEAMAYAEWCQASSEEGDYSIPTTEEWQTAWKAMRETETIELASKLSGKVTDRTLLLLQNVGKSHPMAKNRADQMLFDQGVIEWVGTAQRAGGGAGWGGHGQTHPSFYSSGKFLERSYPIRSIPSGPSDANGRMPFFGFRLLRRES